MIVDSCTKNGVGTVTSIQNGASKNSGTKHNDVTWHEKMRQLIGLWMTILIWQITKISCVSKFYVAFMLGLKNSEVFLFTSKIKADCMQGGDQTRAYWLTTSYNQKLGIVGEIDWKSKTAPLLQRCFLPNVSRDRRFKRAWSDCALCIPIIPSGSPNKRWLHTYTCCACLKTTWRLAYGLFSSPAKMMV